MTESRDRDPRLELRADCGACAGLCCEAPAFSVSADFAIDKPARTPCPHLALVDELGFGCTIHTELPERGFRGCVVYDCFGAGQAVVRAYAGVDASEPNVRRKMLDAFELLERLHEVFWYLADAVSRDLPRGLADEVDGLADHVRAIARLSPVGGPEDRRNSAIARLTPAGGAEGGRSGAIARSPSLTEADVLAVQQRAGVLLGEVSAHLRRGLDGEDLSHADLAGQDLRERDLFAASLRGAVLIGADLRELDLGSADLLGADLRAADLRGADLSETFCLTLLQVRAARTEGALLPDVLR